MHNKHRIWFFYPSGPILTGQELASQMILDLLNNEKNLAFRIVKLAAFDRKRKYSFLYWLQFAASVGYACYQMLLSGINNNSVVYLNLSQSMKSLLIEGVPFVIVSIFNPCHRSVISLHGHFFMEWSPESNKAKLFIWILANSSKVTVLGESQKNKLIEWGLPQEKIQIVNNTCEEIIEGLPKKKGAHDAINLLYFGNLIEAKGYREYLMAILLLSSKYLKTKVNAVICGQFTETSLNGKENPKTVAWMNQIINEINKSLDIQISWTQGAYGAEKAKIFSDADILVFPSYYRVEAQPIVMVEGMAAGCAIVASSVGEIPSMLADGVGECMKDPSPENIANSIADLINTPDKLQKIQIAARERFESRYSRTIYANTWFNIFVALMR